MLNAYATVDCEGAISPDDSTTRPSIVGCSTRERQESSPLSNCSRENHQIIEELRFENYSEEEEEEYYIGEKLRTTSETKVFEDVDMSRPMDEGSSGMIINNNNLIGNNNNNNNGQRERKNSRKEILRRKFSGNSIVSFVNTLCKGNSSKLTQLPTQTDRIEEKLKQNHEECCQQQGHVSTPVVKTRKSSRNSMIIRPRKKSIVMKDDGKDFSLHLAAVNGDLELLRKLVTQGHCVQTEDNVRRTPLEYAVLGGNFDCAAYLIESGADVTKIKNGIH